MFDYVKPTPNASLVEVMDAYNFIGHNFLFDESMVILAHLLKLPLEDVLYFQAKEATGNMLTQPHMKTVLVRHKPLSEESPEVQEYAASSNFANRNSEDIALGELAKTTIQTLFATIPELTPSLAKFKLLLIHAKELCHDHEVGFADQACYWEDNGCGYKCLDMLKVL